MKIIRKTEDQALFDLEQLGNGVLTFTYPASAGCILLSPVLGAIVVGCGIAAYLLCIAVIFKTFGGMSGDLAGWLLQVVELVMLLAAAIGGFYLC